MALDPADETRLANIEIFVLALRDWITTRLDFEERKFIAAKETEHTSAAIIVNRFPPGGGAAGWALMLRRLSLTPVRRRARFPGHGEPAEPLRSGGRCREPSIVRHTSNV